jgi:hypothetical protein
LYSDDLCLCSNANVTSHLVYCNILGKYRNSFLKLPNNNIGRKGGISILGANKQVDRLIYQHDIMCSVGLFIHLIKVFTGG